jgi:poly-gamma-glutamate synthesis protein (capsule biosynthesis protein)
MGGGPHSLRGIEIYKGKPIFYGLGLFFFKPDVKATQETALQQFPDSGIAPAPDPRPHSPASWYDSVLAIVDFDGPRATTVRLYPIDLTNASARGKRGLPHLAEGDNANRILSRLQQESARLGTTINIEGPVGRIRILKSP